MQRHGPVVVARERHFKIENKTKNLHCLVEATLQPTWAAIEAELLVEACSSWTRLVGDELYST